MPRDPQRSLPSGTTPAAAITDGFLAYAFRGESWAVWRAVLRAAWGEPLSDDDMVLFRSVAGDRAPPAHRVSEMWCVAGRRSGKDSIASAIAACLAIGDYSGHLRPGERGTILTLATDTRQAAIARSYITGLFTQTPVLRPLIQRETQDGLELVNGVDIITGTNSFRGVRGRTLLAAILDECAFYMDDGSANPAAELYSALTPALSTIPGAMMIGISSPWRRSGLLFDKWKRHFGEPDDDVLVVHGPTLTFNPTVPRKIIDRDLAADPEKAESEWLGKWRSDLSDLFDRDLVESAVEPGRHVRPPQPGVQYVAFADPSGGRGDSFTLAIAHSDDDGAVLDLLYEKRAPFDPTVALAEIADLLRSYGVVRIEGDRYACQIASKGDPLFACKSDPSGGVGSAVRGRG